MKFIMMHGQMNVKFTHF